MIKVCDAIMGTGKSESVISYINSHPEKRFIYITPYLDEASRIKKGCPAARFAEPTRANETYKHSKVMHTHALIQEGRNIASTHQAFKFYTSETVDLIRERDYTLIIDENVDVLEKFDASPQEAEVAVRAKYIEPNGDGYKLIDNSYSGRYFREMFRLLQSRDLIEIRGLHEQSYYFWQLPIDFIMAFQDVYILTYMFEGQSLHHLLEMNRVPYQYISVQKTADNRYHFTDGPGYVPDYVRTLPQMIDILDHPKLNEIGEKPFALSMSWFAKSSANTEQLRKHLNNYFRNIMGDEYSNQRMWGTYNNGKSKIQGRGYTKAFVVFNSKAVNCYRDKSILAYCANPFMNVAQKTFYQSKGVDPQEDLYSLSTLVQWIWRSAIRDGKPIQLYLPSSRMRNLLKDWIDVTANLAYAGENLSPEKLITDFTAACNSRKEPKHEERPFSRCRQVRRSKRFQSDGTSPVIEQL